MQRHCRDTGLADDNDVEILTRKIDSGKTRHLISAAEDISQRLREHGAGVFRGWLQNTIGRLKVVEPAILEAVAALPGVLATLNYDNLHEDATGRSAITWRERDKVRARRGGAGPEGAARHAARLPGAEPPREKVEQLIAGAP